MVTGKITNGIVGTYEKVDPASFPWFPPNCRFLPDDPVSRFHGYRDYLVLQIAYVSDVVELV